MDAIYKRRSIRKYTSRKVPYKILLDFIKAGMNAPSAGNEQPWHFVIIDDRNLLNKITKIHPYSSMLKQAPAAILVCADLDLLAYDEYWVQDCSAASENILLEIADKGLGAVWLSIYPLKDRIEGIKNLLNIPERVIPFSLISLGYPAEEKALKNEFKEDRIKRNYWN